MPFPSIQKARLANMIQRTFIIMLRYFPPPAKKELSQVIIFSLCFEKKATYDLVARRQRRKLKRKAQMPKLKMHKNRHEVFTKAIGHKERTSCIIGFWKFTTGTLFIST
jgi:hypothetical protein